jgi:hypothetical protein
MANYYYLNENNQTIGPHTFEELAELARKGMIWDATLVAADGQDQWRTWREMTHADGAARVNEPASGVGLPEEMAATAAKLADKLSKGMGSADFGSFFFGVLLAFLGVFILPWQLIKQSFQNLSAWGRQKTLPTSQSDLPTCTFLTIVMRHFICFLYVLSSLYSMMDTLFGREASPIGFSTGNRFADFLVVTLGSYFGIIILHFIFEFFAVFIYMANSLKKIEGKS